jgi:glycosyltransferase involved in cell wall biosynthesis
MVSIIIASYNKGQYIEDTVSSILAQTYTNWEVIIVDDNSSDGTQEKLFLFSGNKRIRVILNKVNKGANYCRNIGLKEASGDHVIIMDADDLLAPFCLQNRVDFLAVNPGLDFAVFSMGTFNKEIGDSKTIWLPSRKDALGSFLTHNIAWSIMQPVWSRYFLSGTGGFDESFERLQDVELHTRVLFERDLKFRCVNGPPDCFYRISEVRLNFDVPELMKRWVDSCIKYYNKFYEPAGKINKQHLLGGTIFKSYLQLLYYLRIEKISREKFNVLEEQLYSLLLNKGKRAHVLFLKITRFFNLLSFRIKGMNRAMYELFIFFK